MRSALFFFHGFVCITSHLSKWQLVMDNRRHWGLFRRPYLPAKSGSCELSKVIDAMVETSHLVCDFEDQQKNIYQPNRRLGLCEPHRSFGGPASICCPKVTVGHVVKAKLFGMVSPLVFKSAQERHVSSAQNNDGNGRPNIQMTALVVAGKLPMEPTFK
ncbi:unnamed protein product [Musa textilis]